MERLTVCSSSGELIVDKSTGKVEIYNCDEGLTWITRFDLEEYRKHYNVTEIPDALDILDLGYWEKVREEDEQYEEPAHEWRIETQNMREGREPDDDSNWSLRSLELALKDLRKTYNEGHDLILNIQATIQRVYSDQVVAYLKKAYSLDLNDTSLDEWITDAIGKQTPVELVDQYAEKYDLVKFI